MSEQLAPLLPIIAPFIIGLLVGVIIKRGLKLIMPIILLIIVLVITGAISVGFGDIYEKAMEILPRITGEAGDLVNVLPYTSVSFLVGLAVGFFKG
jgi:uncharacterized membrane protein (Fun14 family)